MKKKFDFKLTAILVSLFIGFLLLVLGNKNKYCLSFGFIVLGISVVLYGLNKRNQLKNLIAKYDTALDEESENAALIIELAKQRNKLTRQKNFTCSMICFFGILLVIGGFVGLI